MRLADVIYLIARRWRYKKKYYVRIIINIAVGLCVYNTIFNLGININHYVKNQFFSNNELKEVLIEGNEQRVVRQLTCLQDKMVKNYRGVIDSKVLVEHIEGDYDEDFTNFDITIIDAYDDLFFDGEYQVENWHGTSIWKTGVMINHKYAELLGEEVIGRQVEFAYDGENYRFPIVGIIDAVLCENITVECQAGMYISVDCLKKEFSDYECMEIQLQDYKDVKDFEKRYQNNKYRIVSQSEEAEHAMYISKTIDLIIVLLVIIFLAYSTIGINNAVQALLNEKINSVTLYRIIGISDNKIYSIELSESFILGSIGGIIGNLFSILLLALFSRSGYLNYSEINSEILFAYNRCTIYIGMALSIFITMLSSKHILKSHIKQEIITCVKSE